MHELQTLHARCVSQLELWLAGAERMAKDGRMHIHRAIERHGLPVTHVTRRAGRPFTLVLQKTRALFVQEAAARKRWQRDLAWLRKAAAAF